jgi:16S rRNA (cytosine967-C5)-methyltransferase
LEVRQKEQAEVLDRAARLVKPGGRIVYITCSVLPEECDDAVAVLLAQREDVTAVEPREALAEAGLSALADAVRFTKRGLQMTPLRTGTDGFFVAVLKRAR